MHTANDTGLFEPLFNRVSRCLQRNSRCTIKIYAFGHSDPIQLGTNRQAPFNDKPAVSHHHDGAHERQLKAVSGNGQRLKAE